MEKDWVCVFSTEQNYTAEIAREVLENDEIDCVVMNDHDSTFPSIGQVEIWVHKDNELTALELLKELIN